MKNFIIVGTQRTGSSVLGEIVGSHPNITCGWEWTLKGIFNNKIKIANIALTGDFSVLRNPDKKHMAKVFHERIEWLGFRRLFSATNKWVFHPRFSPRLFIERFEQHLKWIKSHPNLHVLHIVRINNIDWLKSRYLAKKHNMYVGKSYPFGTKVRIPVDEVIKLIQSKYWIDKQLGTVINSNPYLRITYEGLCNDINLNMNQVFRFFHTEGINTSLENTKLKKQSTSQAHEYIENYDELFTALKRKDILTASFY